jgi:hypothetical protein
VEVTVGARGIRQGKKPKCVEDYTKLQSRLSRAALVQLQQKSLCRRTKACTACESSSIPETAESSEFVLKELCSWTAYQEYKKHHCSTRHQALRRVVFKQGPLAGWLIGNAGIDNDS